MIWRDAAQNIIARVKNRKIVKRKTDFLTLFLKGFFELQSEGGTNSAPTFALDDRKNIYWVTSNKHFN